MCYKADKHKYLSIKLSEKLSDVPLFISDFFDRYKSAATKNCNWGYIRDLLQWLLDKGYIEKENITQITTEDMDKITSNHVIKYLNELKDGITGRKNSLDSICTKKNVFSAFWNYMFMNKYVTDNIIRHIPGHLYKSEVTQKEVVVPTDKQVEDFLNNLNSGNGNEFNIIRNIAIVKLIMGSGIRSEELINLDVNDLHLDEERPYIMVLGKGKIEQYDKVYVSKEAKECVEEYLIERSIFVRENNVESNGLFLSNERKRMSKTAITSFFDKYSNGTIFPHSLRHLVGTKLYEKTKDIIVVQKQLRHQNLETAAKYYVHIEESTVANAMMEL
jgi:site-specific recombinase XerD